MAGNPYEGTILFNHRNRRIAMAIRIFAGGCRSTADTGKVEERYCNECPEQTACDLEPRARELARMIASHWVKTRDVLPPKGAGVLYLEYPSVEPSGTVHYGYYDQRRRKFIEQESGEATLKDLVIAWMLVPKVPVETYKEGWSL
jgi:hypothetical protein